MERLLALLALLLAIVSLAHCVPFPSSSLENITISVPEGTTNHGNPRLLCPPSKWTDIATFFLANFVAHAATVKAMPGEPTIKVTIVQIAALFSPISGAVRGLNAIFRHAKTGKTPLQVAKKAGALCEVVRAPEWKPQTGDFIRAGRFNTRYWSHVSKVRAGYTRLEDPVEDVKIRIATVSPRLDKIGSLLARSPFLQRLYYQQIAKYHPVWLRLRGQIHSSKLFTKDLQMNHFSYRNDQNDHNTECHQDHVQEPSHASNTEQSQPGQITSRVSPNHPASIPSAVVQTRSCSFWVHDSSLTPFGLQVQGTCCLPPGFELAIVHPDCTVSELENNKHVSQARPLDQAPAATSIGSSYSLGKAVVAILQTVYAGVTLYGTRGDQLASYGYAAFGLTVAPYLVMSLVNLLGNVLTPDYSTMYMVHSDIMDEAQRRSGAHFEGVVGKLRSSEAPVEFVFEVDPQARKRYIRKPSGQLSEVAMSERPHPSKDTIPVPASHSYPPDYGLLQGWLGINHKILFSSLLIGILVLALNGSTSRFEAGNSTPAQKVLTMLWLAFGTTFGVVSSTLNVGSDGYWDIPGPFSHWNEAMRSLWLFGLMFWIYIPSLGGFVVVGQMLSEYGHCVQIY